MTSFFSHPRQITASCESLILDLNECALNRRKCHLTQDLNWDCFCWIAEFSYSWATAMFCCYKLMAKVFKVMLCGALPGKSHLKEHHVLVPGTVELNENGIQSCDALEHQPIWRTPLERYPKKNKRQKVVNTSRFMRTHTLSVVGVSNAPGGQLSCRVKL